MLTRTRRWLPAIASLLALAACKAELADQIEEPAAAPSETLGLMTSLPLYWPLGADFAAIANGTAEVPWQRGVLERGYELVLLDTLSPIPGLTPDAPESDPLAAIEHLAVIQPRGLSPADNVALDDWVRDGGQLLLVLDPQLTGDYDLALGDPRRPADTALVAPVVTRWGLDIDFPLEAALDDSLHELPLGSGTLTAERAGRIEIVNADAADCELFANNVVARCSIGEGFVTLVADAAVFEHQSLAGAQGEAIANLLRFAFP
ncbi:hypothetical protein [uncultured Erythrobacter sp.]|uniref:hypothetical protein n=1 Tax=uncultured Erythrobacter sp. TaxID=263913 RepID=UPI002603C6E6|nr:hypothetical protein [uncultured Erythrobacter sp.]